MIGISSAPKDKNLDEYYNIINKIFMDMKDSLPDEDDDVNRELKFMLYLLHEKIEEEYTKIKYKSM